MSLVNQIRDRLARRAANREARGQAGPAQSASPARGGGPDMPSQRRSGGSTPSAPRRQLRLEAPHGSPAINVAEQPAGASDCFNAPADWQLPPYSPLPIGGEQTLLPAQWHGPMQPPLSQPHFAEIRPATGIPRIRPPQAGIDTRTREQRAEWEMFQGAQARDAERLALALQHRPPMNVRGPGGRAVLHEVFAAPLPRTQAEWSATREIVLALMNAGARLNDADERGVTPLYAARDRRYLENPGITALVHRHYDNRDILRHCVAVQRARARRAMNSLDGAV